MDNPETSAAPHDQPVHSVLGFRVIGAMKIASGILLIAAGFGIFRLLNHDLGAETDHIVKRLHLDPENRLVHEVLSRVAGISRGQLKGLGIGTFFYALLHLVEGTGLIFVRPWAEYLTVIATSSLLPLEVYEIARRPTLVRFGVFLINVAILLYLIVKIRQQRKHHAS
jgi:uncharacterized membrane protein (DUF2068 family)